MTPKVRSRAFGATPAESAELAAYLDSAFPPATDPGLPLPLPDEPFVPWWAAREEEARCEGAFAVLRRHLPQLAFPIRQGMSRDPAYRAATLGGAPVEAEGAAVPAGLELPRPERVELHLHGGPAGRVPVLVVRCRESFELLVQALARRNEPVPVHPSQGAAIVGGYNNMARLGELRRAWEEAPPGERSPTWGDELVRLRQHKDLYQDRFVLLSDGPYSGVPAAEVGMDEATWRRASLRIRRDHECAHHFTRRRFGIMRNHLHDELLADYAGLVAAFGSFSAQRFLRLLESRAGLYRGEPPLSDGALAVALRIVAAAARRLEEHDRRFPVPTKDAGALAARLAAVAALRLDELAAEDAVERLADAEADATAGMGGGGSGLPSAPTSRGAATQA